MFTDYRVICHPKNIGACKKRFLLVVLFFLLIRTIGRRPEEVRDRGTEGVW